MKASWEKISLSSPTRSHWLHWNLNLHFKKFSGTSFQPLQSHMRHLSHWAKQQKPIMWHSMTWGHAWQWSLEFFTVTRKFAKGISAALNKFYFTFLLYIWLKGYGLGMNCSFSSNPPEDDTALCVYISLQYQETPTTSTLVITSAQAGKQVVPSSVEPGQPEVTWLRSCFASPRIATPCHHS